MTQSKRVNFRTWPSI